MNEKKINKIFEKELSKRESSKRWSKKIASAVFASEFATEPLSVQQHGLIMSFLSYSFTISAAVAVLVGAIFLNTVLRHSIQEGSTVTKQTVLEDFFNPYSYNNIHTNK
ncbi:MAG TPA: hypothetical protein PK926_16820 [Spirochaetota bacterium]|nr:hypothetical protein [Spirochaetota bacterium]HPI90720.1 hypothetical protein [Spirochaetota bacterium]HPR49741.1 hypothetical protein [Spirochaetota bacterium]